jgi:hypothetical protein
MGQVDSDGRVIDRALLLSKYRSCELLAKTGPLLQWVFIGRLCSRNSPTAPP